MKNRYSSREDFECRDMYDDAPDMPTAADFADDIEEDINDLCGSCNGTGEGDTPDTTCHRCKGSGSPKRNTY